MKKFVVWFPHNFFDVRSYEEEDFVIPGSQAMTQVWFENIYHAQNWAESILDQIDEELDSMDL